MKKKISTLTHIIYVHYQKVRLIYINRLITLMNYNYLALLAVTLSIHALYGRSPFRTPEQDAPMIHVHYVGQQDMYKLASSYLQAGPLFNTFDKQFFFDHLVPKGPISYRYDATKSVTGAKLETLIKELLSEINQKRKTYTNFTILKDRDFRKNDDRTGLLIVKFNDYPFVVKLFIETPKSFVNPYKKGFEPCCFFIMASGTRHLNGFTRIPNLESLNRLIKQSPQWRDILDTPRKWYWLSEQHPWIEIIGYHLGDKRVQSIRVPSVYAVICDEIAIEHEFDLHNPTDRARALEVANFFEQRIDPHINNYVIEKWTGKIVPIDFEFFPSMVGLKKHVPCNNYVQWYGKLSCKMVHDTFGRSKQVRRAAQYSTYTPLKDY